MAVTRSLSQTTLDNYFDQIGRLLGRSERRANFALYAMGLLSKLERKSLEPIAALAAGDDPKVVAKVYDHLLQFSTYSPWDDHAVRSFAADYALRPMRRRGDLDVWIIDDTGFLKQGSESVGVKRQYTGTAGKVTNCQVAVSLTVATRQQHLPIDMELYLPEEWTENPERRTKAKLPEDVKFRTKADIALDMLGRWVLEGVELGTLCADGGYGYDLKFRGGVTQLGFEYVLGTHSDTVVRLTPERGKKGPEQSVKKLALSLPKSQYRKVTWAEGTRRSLWSRFAYVRVELANPDPAEPVEQGLLIEWPANEPEPTGYSLVTLPKKTPLKEVVRKGKARWRIEGGYEEMKGELGLDHFEGRSWIGWNHHVSIVLACYALTIASKMRAFPPSAARAKRGGANEAANDAALP